MKFNKRGKIRAPIKLVFEILTDIEVLRDEIAQSSRGESFKLNYDRKKPFGVGNRIVLSMSSPVCISTITRFESPNLLEMTLEPNKKYINLWGVCTYSASLEKINEVNTEYKFSFESTKNPKGFMKLLIWVYFHSSFFFAKKRMKRRITNRLKKGRLPAAS